MDTKLDTKNLTAFERRLLYSMKLAIISRAEAEGLLPFPGEAMDLKNKIRRAYYEDTGHRL